MIEIRELVIRATVDDSPRNNGGRESREAVSSNTESTGSYAENLDTILKIIKDKKER